MQALKALVIGMGVLLVLGIAGLVYAIVTDAGKRPSAEEAPAMGAAPAQMGPAPMGNVPARIDVPAGTDLVAIHPDGGRLYLHLKTADGARILVLDASSGAALGSIEVRRAEAE